VGRPARCRLKRRAYMVDHRLPHLTSCKRNRRRRRASPDGFCRSDTGVTAS
jgi:hypothetical protein